MASPVVAAPPAPAPPAPAAPPALPTGTTHVSYTMAAVCAAGGVGAFAAARSARSLVAGLGVAAAFGYAGASIGGGEETKGFRVGAVASAGLALLMAQRVYRTGRALPGAPLGALACASGAYHAHKYSQWAELE